MANTMRIRLKIEDRIALAAIALLGREILPAAYAMCHPSVTTTNADSLSTMCIHAGITNRKQKHIV